MLKHPQAHEAHSVKQPLQEPEEPQRPREPDGQAGFPTWYMKKHSYISKDAKDRCIFISLDLDVVEHSDGGMVTLIPISSGQASARVRPPEPPPPKAPEAPGAPGDGSDPGDAKNPTRSTRPLVRWGC